MNSDELDTVLESLHEGCSVEPAVLDRAREPVLASLTPVRPMAASRVFVTAFLVIFATLAIGGALVLGQGGFDALSLTGRWMIYPALGALALVTALTLSAEMTPGSRHRSAALAAGVGILVFEALIFVLFRNYSIQGFVPIGVHCLRAGLAFAAPAAAMLWLIAGRGILLHSVSAGTAIGTLAGLTGLGMLEIECPLLTVPHVGVWHVAVVVVSAAAGALIGALPGIWTRLLRLAGK